MSMNERIPIALLVSLAALAGCAGQPDSDEPSTGEAIQAVSPQEEGRRLFEEETFGGNGRTCATCHGAETGTVSPAEAQQRFAEDPNDPLFLFDGSDDFQGNGATRMLADATVLVRIPLPPNVTLANDPTATSVVVRRGIPTTLNTPALDPVLMSDGRMPNLVEQSRDAIHGHAQSTIEPTEPQLARIAEYQKTNAFFSSSKIKNYFEHGTPPELPQGNTDEEKRGRIWFEDVELPLQINQNTPRKGLCAQCHSGPLLNESNGFSRAPYPPYTLPKGRRFVTNGTSDFNLAGNPVYDFLVHLPDGTTIPVQSPDPGRALIDGDFSYILGFNAFKIPTLWGVKDTAPYFHDNHAKTLEAAVEHYALFFSISTSEPFDGDPPLVLTPQDKADLLAFLKLL